MFDPLINEQIRQHAIDDHPHESVGAVVKSKKTGRITYKRMENVSDDPENHFRVDGREYARICRTYEVLGVVHSHPDGELQPSVADSECQLAFKIPFGIVVSSGSFHGASGSASDPIWWGDQAPIPPLLGRRFVFGVTDCWALVRDHFRLNVKDRDGNPLVLIDGPRRDNFWRPIYDEKGVMTRAPDNIYMEGLGRSGFVEVDRADIQPNDVVLMKIYSQIPNHAAVYLGGDVYLDHMAEELSKKSTGLMRHKNLITGVYRHESQFVEPNHEEEQ